MRFVGREKAIGPKKLVKLADVVRADDAAPFCGHYFGEPLQAFAAADIHYFKEFYAFHSRDADQVVWRELLDKPIKEAPAFLLRFFPLQPG